MKCFTGALPHDRFDREAFTFKHGLVDHPPMANTATACPFDKPSRRFARPARTSGPVARGDASFAPFRECRCRPGQTQGGPVEFGRACGARSAIRVAPGRADRCRDMTSRMVEAAGLNRAHKGAASLSGPALTRLQIRSVRGDWQDISSPTMSPALLTSQAAREWSWITREP